MKLCTIQGTFLIMVEMFICISKLIYSIVNWKIIIMCLNSQVLDVFKKAL